MFITKCIAFGLICLCIAVIILLICITIGVCLDFWNDRKRNPPKPKHPYRLVTDGELWAIKHLETKGRYQSYWSFKYHEWKRFDNVYIETCWASKSTAELWFRRLTA